MEKKFQDASSECSLVQPVVIKNVYLLIWLKISVYL